MAKAKRKTAATNGKPKRTMTADALVAEYGRLSEADKAAFRDLAGWTAEVAAAKTDLERYSKTFQRHRQKMIRRNEAVRDRIVELVAEGMNDNTIAYRLNNEGFIKKPRNGEKPTVWTRADVKGYRQRINKGKSG